MVSFSPKKLETITAINFDAFPSKLVEIRLDNPRFKQELIEIIRDLPGLIYFSNQVGNGNQKIILRLMPAHNNRLELLQKLSTFVRPAAFKAWAEKITNTNIRDGLELSIEEFRREEQHQPYKNILLLSPG